MQIALAGVDNLKPSAAFYDGMDADAVEDLANDNGDDDGGDDDDDIFVANILPADGGGDKEGKGNSPQTQASPLKKPQLKRNS